MTAQARADEARPQRLLIVTPTTGQFHSPTHRLASAAVERGHEATVIARSGPDLAADERRPEGYRVLRFGAERTAGAGTRSVGSRAMRRLLDLRAGRRDALRLAPRADLVVGSHYLGIGTALALGRRDGVPVVYDAGDIYLASTAILALPWPIRAAIRRYERSAARRADRVVTANDAYAAELARRLGVELPVVVMNCPPRIALPPAAPGRRFHERLGLAPETRVVLYHGGFTPERGIEELIAVIDRVDRAVLVLLGFGELEASLRTIAADPATGGRVRVLPAVPPAELLDWVAAADVAAMPIRPTTLNHRLSTPNKLFEAMAVGVPVVASDLPGMAAVVRAVDFGVLVDPSDPSALAAGLASVLDAPPEIRSGWRDRALAAAAAAYNWETQVAKLFAEFSGLTGRSW